MMLRFWNIVFPTMNFYGWLLIPIKKVSLQEANFITKQQFLIFN
jgi:hypothetical protein